MNQSKIREFIPVLVFLVFILVFWALLAGMPTSEIVNTQPVQADGIQDLREADFDNSIYVVSHKIQWESWGDKLYGPQDLTEEIVREARVLDDEDYKIIQFATHRTKMLLTPGKVYGISMKSADYSMRIFIGGEEIDSVGVPADTKEETVPRTNKRVYYFSPKTEVVDIVIQAANFVHNEGAYPPILFIGSYENIAHKQLTDSFMTFMIIGCLLTAGIHHLALFLLNRRRKTDFIFSVCCFLLLLMTNEFIPFFFPEYNWYIAFRLEYIVHYATFAAMTWLFHTLMPKALNKWVWRIFEGVCAVFTLSVFVFDTVIFSSFIQYFHYISIAFTLYLLVCLAAALKYKNIKNVLAFAGAFIMGLFAINDIILHMPVLTLPHYPGSIMWGLEFTAPVGMVFFVCCYSLILAVDYAETQRREEMLTERNAFLDNLNQTKSEFLQNISHEMKTPLTVISTDILNAGDQLDFDMDKEDMRRSLRNAQLELMRMSRMVDSALKFSSIQEAGQYMKPLDMASLLSVGAETYRSLMERRGNTLTICVPESLPAVFGNADMLLQVLSNLLSNANRHTCGGEISIGASAGDGSVTVTVRDNGEGIKPELLTQVWARGVSTGGTGLGLSICKSIIKNHNGQISLESEYGKGTTVIFSLPAYKRLNKGETGHE